MILNGILKKYANEWSCCGLGYTYIYTNIHKYTDIHRETQIYTDIIAMNTTIRQFS
jgi:hypothetical protein